MVAFEMRDISNETANRSLLPLRKAIIEPVFGQIKFNRGFARFRRRGLSAARSEWKVICMTHNLLQYWRTKTAAPAMASQSANAHVIWSADYSRNSLFGWFVAGLVVYALLLIFATVAGKPGAA
jgi:hypothetical protein